MGMLIDKSMESSLVNLVNDGLGKCKVYLDKYQRINFYIYNQDILNNLLKEGRFKDKGNVYDFPNDLPQPEAISAFEITANYKLFQRIALSNKFNAVMFYSVDAYSIACTVLIDVAKLKKFVKIVKEIIRHDSGGNIFRDTNFDCNKNEYIEISEPIEDKTKLVDIAKKEVIQENLVFDENSTINEVMGDIITFFKDETKDLYKKLELSYKRGSILHGDPGNGKSAMLRQIIRTIPDVSKIILNPSIDNPIRILHALTKALNGKKALVIMEDLDSMINESNRSEFLNILDGVDIRSGIYFIGTTNYPERIDPALMNRSGRFDRTYPINNPSETTRRLFFESRKIGKLLADYKVFKDDKKKDTDEGVVGLFVKHSHDLPMASLKELITSTAYLLASNTEMSVEEAVEKCFEKLSTTRNEHIDSHNEFRRRRRMMDEDDDDYGPRRSMRMGRF